MTFHPVNLHKLKCRQFATGQSFPGKQPSKWDFCIFKEIHNAQTKQSKTKDWTEEGREERRETKTKWMEKVINLEVDLINQILYYTKSE